MASEDKKKVVGLDTVWVFKDYIDKVREEIENNTDLSMKEYFDTKFKEVTNDIKDAYDSQYDELNKRLEYVEQFGTPEEVEQIRLQLDALIANTNDKFDALEALNKELEILSGEYEGLKNSVFTEGQINELISAAMIDGVTITDDTISAENIYASKLVAFIGNFAKISASQIEGGEITGHTIASSEFIPGSSDRRWQIGNEGEGWLANKQISWNANGNVALGDKVTLKWANVDGGKDYVDGQNNVVNKRINTLNTELNKLDNQVSILSNLTGGSTAALNEFIDIWTNDDYIDSNEIAQISKEYNQLNAEYDKVIGIATNLNDRLQDAADKTELDPTDADYLPYPAEDFTNDIVDLTDLESLHNIAKDVYEYYTNPENLVKDEEGNSKGYVLRNASYDINAFATYYAEQTDVVSKCNVGLSNLQQHTRFGSKFTYIGSDGIYSGSIAADQITGLVTTSTAAQSSKEDVLPKDLVWYEKTEDGGFKEITGDGKTKGPLWQLWAEGSGHLAKGNINWNKDGKLNAIIDTGTLGQPNPDVDDPEYPMRWTDDTIYIDRNLVFGNNASITWSNNTKPETGAGLNEDGVKNIIDGYVDKTYIDDLGIEAASISANALSAHEGYIKDLAAGSIDADNITAKIINTTPDSGENNSGRIMVAGNELEVYSADEDKMILRITGETLDNQAAQPEIETFNLSPTVDFTSGTFYMTATTAIKIGSFTLSEQNCKYKLSLNNVAATLKYIYEDAFTGGPQVAFDYIVVASGTSAPTKTDTLGTVAPIGNYPAGGYTKSIIELSPATAMQGVLFDAGSYDVYLRSRTEKYGAFTDASQVVWNLTVNNAGTITATPNIDSMVEGLTCFSADGFRYVKTTENYFKFDGNGYFTYYGPYANYGMGVDDSGIWFQYQGSKYGISIDSSGNLKATER